MVNTGKKLIYTRERLERVALFSFYCVLWADGVLYPSIYCLSRVEFIPIDLATLNNYISLF